MPDPNQSIEDFLGSYKPPLTPGTQQPPDPTTDEQSAEIGDMAGASIAPPAFTPATPKPVTVQSQPSIEDFLGSYKPANAPTVAQPMPSFTDLYAAASGAKPEDWYTGVKATSIGRIMDAFGSGVTGAYSDPLGFSDETKKALQNNLFGGDFDPIPGQKTLSSAIFNGVVAPVAAAADAAYRLLPAVINGTANAAYQAGQETGTETGEQIGRTVAGFAEYSMQRGDILGNGMPETPAEIARHAEAGETSTVLGRIDLRDRAAAETLALQEKTRIELAAQSLDASKDFGATGSEGDYFGTEKTNPLVINPGNSLPGEREGISFVGPKEPEAEAAPDIHSIARQIAPEVFSGPKGYDALQIQRDTFSRWLDELKQQRDTEAEANPPHAPELTAIDDQITAITDKVRGVEDRLTKTQAAELSDLRGERADIEAQVQDQSRAYTPDMLRVQEALQKTDYQMRDLAPQVSAAYREAQSRLPQAEEPIAEPVKAPEKVGTIASEEPAAPVVAKVEPPAETAAPEEAPKPKFVPATDIASDVSRKLVAAGRPQEEADAASALIASHYEARAANLKGVTAEQLYRDEAPDIRAGKSRALTMAQREGRTLGQDGTLFDAKESTPEEMAARQRQAQKEEAEARMLGKKGGKKAQSAFDETELGGGKGTQGSLFQGKRGSITLNDSRNVIKLFKDADASTFLHEVGHQWLEELMGDAVDERATDSVRTDAATVRDWLGVKDGEAIPTKAHEKFARGFERYMMEGRAPSKALADVFAKFKAWLTQIYNTVNKLRSPINDDIRDVFDRLVTKEPEKAVIAPDRELPGLADRHEALELAAKPGTEHEVANRIEAESEAQAGRQIPEVQNAVTRGIENASGTGAPESAAPDRGEPAGQPDTGEPVSRPTMGTVGEGGSPAPAEGAGRKQQFVHERVPREPQRLLGFLRSIGGIKDEGGEVSAITGKKGSFGGLVNNKSGLSLDEATMRAREEGYLGRPETSTHGEEAFGGGARDIDQRELTEALADDIAGKAQYSEKDLDKVAAYTGALERNAEINRLGDEHGLDANQMPRDEFFAKLYERMSQNEAVKVSEEQADSTLAEIEEAQRRADEEMQAHGDAWEPEPERNIVPRSLEDLENERRSEADAGRTDTGQGIDEQPRPIPADEGAGEVGARPRGDSLGSGRPNPEAGATGRSAGRSSGTDHPELAGNIQLRNLVFKRLGSVVDEQDVRDLVKQIAAENSDLNDARFGEPSYQLQRQVWAAGQILETTAIDATEALQKWKASGSEDDALAYKYAADKVLLAANVRSELAAGIGRGLAAFRKIQSRGEAESIVDYIKRTTGKTLFQLEDEADLFGALETPDQKAGFLNAMRANPWLTTKSMILSYFINNLISGPITHLSYSIGNTFWSMFKAGVTTTTAAAIDSAREAFTGQRIPDRVYFREATAQVAAMWRGGRDSIPAAWRAVQTGTPYMEGLDEMARRTGEELPSYGVRPQVLPGAVGRALEFPSRAVTGIHTVFYAVNYEGEIMRRAVRSGLAKDLTGDELETHIANFVAKPPDKDVAQAHDEALKMVLMQRPAFDSSMANLQRFVNNNFAAKIVMPFMQIGSNILREGMVEHSPLGLLSGAVRENLSGRNGAIARSTQYAKIAVGTVVATTVMGLASEGIITGGGPSDPKQRQLMQSTGWAPYAIKLGHEYIPFRKFLGPMGPLMAAAADMYEIGHTAATEGFAKAGTALVLGLSEVVFDETWMSGLSSFLDAARNYDRDGGKYLRGLAMDFIPFSVGMGQVAKLIDPETRVVRSFTDAVKNKIPFLSEILTPMRDVWGEPVPSRLMVSPSREKPDPVVDALEQLQLYPARPQGTINGIKLNPKEYDDYIRIAGRQAHMRIAALVETPGFPAQMTADPSGVKRAIQEIIKSERASARRQVLMQSDVDDGPNSIRIQSTANKMKKLYGAYQ